MKYLDIKTVVNSYEGFQNCMTNKSWGYLALLKGCKSRICSSIPYEVKLDVVSNFLEDIFNLSQSKRKYNGGRSLYVIFSKKWDNYFKYQGDFSPNIYDVAVWAYRRKSFSDDTTKEDILKIFASEFNIPIGLIENSFNTQSKNIEFSQSLYPESQLKTELNKLGVDVSHDNIDAKKGGVVASPGEISRGPFIQTLYAGLDITDYVIILQSNYFSLYGNNTQANDVINEEKLTYSFQQIFYGAPGTGKSHKIKKHLEGVSKDNIFRTTFHPDSDYSTFVGAYKPIKGKRPLYGLNGGLTVRLNDGGDLSEDIITYNFRPQAFLNAYIQAYKKPNENVYLIIEEINRGNCAQIFGDLFQLLDRDENGVSEYTIKADTDLNAFLEEELGKDNPGIKDGELCLPSNLYIYATMNTSDQSLFPIDSAFKRRWDWEYEPIKYKNTDWVIDIDGLKYRWIDFQKEVNTRILDDTGSEDKMLGDYFVNPQAKVIGYNLFRNKILFYLWNDVCKDGGADIFPTDRDFSFSKLYAEDSKRLIISMMDKLELKPIDGNDTENEEGHDMSEGNDDNTTSVRYSINGEDTDENGNAWGKGALVKRAVEIYCNNHDQYTAAQIRDIWMSANFIIPHIVETDEDRELRIKRSKDPNAEGRSKEIKLPNGESLYVSTQVGDGKQRKGFSDFLSKIKSKPEWGLDIQEL